MDKIRKSFRSRKKNDKVPESSKPHQWQEDERKVREGCCSFQVKYLGCHEVFESRGIQVCEDAVKVLKAKCHRSVWTRMSMRKKSDDSKAKNKSHRAILYVSGDALRVVDEISKGLIVDQTIEKVSFCAPDRNYDKAFAYICRDGTTRRWLCHAFLAVKESGERLSHAVGCAFAICLEKKQKREKDAVEVTFNAEGTSFARTGSFRPATLTERLADPQSTILAEPVPKPSQAAGVVTASVERPHATDNMLQKQASFRGFNKLSQSLPFKRQSSLRLGELPSTLERQQAMWTNDGFQQLQQRSANGRVSPIAESSPTEEENMEDACKQLTEGLSALVTDDPFSSAPFGHSSAVAAVQVHASSEAQRSVPSSVATTTSVASPWSVGVQSPEGEADKWLHSVASSVSMSRGNVAPPAGVGVFPQPPIVMATPATVPFQPATSVLQSTYPTVYPAQAVLMATSAQPFAQQQQQQSLGLQGQQSYSPSPQVVAYPPSSAQPVSFNGGGFAAVSQQPTFPSASYANWNATMNNTHQPPQSASFATPAAVVAVPSPARLPSLSSVHATAYGGTNGGIVSVSSLANAHLVTSHRPSLSLQERSQTFDVAPSSDASSRPPTLAAVAQQSATTSAASQSLWTSFNGSHAIGPTTLDPFDVAWAAKTTALKSNAPPPAVPVAGQDVRSFHVNL